jgi:ATP-binding cassette, subfamily B, bacterial
LTQESDTKLADEKKRRSLKPLRRMLPYLMRHKGNVASAMFFLAFAAATTLVLPLAVRQMIDHGFSAADKGYINGTFLMLLGLAAVLSPTSAATCLPI